MTEEPNDGEGSMAPDSQAEAAAGRGRPPDLGHTQVAGTRLRLTIMGTVLALVIVVIGALNLRGTQEYPQGSPEAALQNFLVAGLDGDRDALVAAISPDFREACSEYLDEASWPDRPVSGIGFELARVRVVDDLAFADVTIRHNANDPFGGTYRRDGYEFELQRDTDEWTVSRAEWPWRLSYCSAKETP